MSLPQDVFGASPKTVLNKPFFHAQDRKPYNVEGGDTTALAYNDRVLNFLVTNEIMGASLGDSLVTLPAGKYYIEITAPAGNTARIQSFLRDVDDKLLLYGICSHAATTSTESTFSSVSGVITLNETTQVKVSTWIYSAKASTGLGWGKYHANIAGVDNVYVDFKAWKLDSDIETPVLSDPTMTLVRPLFHAQYPVNASHNMDAGVRTAILDTVLTNDIPGASLAANEVTLPAGEYYIQGYGLARCTEANPGTVTIKKTDDTVLLNGSTTGAPELVVNTDGRIVLSETTTIKMVVEQKHTGGAISLNNLSTPGIVNDLRIWQLDAVVRTPVLVNDKLFPLPGNVQVTGNMYGLDYAKTGANEVTIQPGACMDSTNEVALQLASAQALSIPAAASTTYHLFLCDDGFVRQDTDVDGAGLVGYKVRWLGMVVNDGAGALWGFKQNGAFQIWTGQYNSNVMSLGTASNTFNFFDGTSILPQKRVESFRVGVNASAAAACWFTNSDDSGHLDQAVYVATSSYQPVSMPMADLSKIGVRISAGSGACCIYSITMKR